MHEPQLKLRCSTFLFGWVLFSISTIVDVTLTSISCWYRCGFTSKQGRCFSSCWKWATQHFPHMGPCFSNTLWITNWNSQNYRQITSIPLEWVWHTSLSVNEQRRAGRGKAANNDLPINLEGTEFLVLDFLQEKTEWKCNLKEFVLLCFNPKHSSIASCPHHNDLHSKGKAILKLLENVLFMKLQRQRSWKQSVGRDKSRERKCCLHATSRSLNHLKDCVWLRSHM